MALSKKAHALHEAAKHYGNVRTAHEKEIRQWQRGHSMDRMDALSREQRIAEGKLISAARAYATSVRSKGRQA